MRTTDRRHVLRFGFQIGLSAVTAGTVWHNGALAQDSESSPEGSELADQLPPADLPTMNEQGFTFALESTYTGTFDGAPAEAQVYLMSLDTLGSDDVTNVADRLGIEGEVEDQGNGSFAIEGNGSLYVSAGLMQYVSADQIPEGALPTDEEAIAFGREWLRQLQLLPADIGEGSIQARIEQPARVIVLYQPVNPAPLLSAYPAISITLGPQGSILEASFRWADISAADNYQLRGAESAWTEVVERRSYLELVLPSDLFPDGSTVSGAAEYSAVSIVYTSSGIPGEQQYLQPVYAFAGRVAPDGAEDTYELTAYVPALINSLQPVGRGSGIAHG